MQTRIYHNPRCSNSRNALAMIKASGETPEIIEYLQTPPNRAVLTEIISQCGLQPREIMRQQDALYKELNLDDAALTTEQLIDAMLANPSLINRPIVVTDKGTRLCRPPELVLDLLANPVAEFTKENGEIVRHPDK